MRNSARSFLITLACCVSLFAQAKSGGTTTGTTTTPSTPTTTTPTTTTPTTTTTTPSVYPSTQPMYVAGRVLTEEGTPPPGSVTIVRICNGVSRAMGYTDTHGSFNFDLNHADSAFQDASNPGTIGSASDPTSTRASLDDPFSSMRGAPSSSSMGSLGGNSSALMGCELRAQLAGYRSTAVQLAQRRSMDDPDVGIIFLHRMGADEGSMVSMTSMMAPKDAKKAFEKGMDALKKKKSEDAQKDFEKAVAVYPKYADAWYRLGALQLEQKNTEAARNSFSQAIAADPKLVTPYVELAILDGRDGKWKETAESAGKAIRLDPVDFPVAFYFDAIANYNLKNYEAAEKSARQLQRLDTQHHYPMADRILASVLADRKDYSGAAQQMRDYLKIAGTAKDADEVRGQLQQLEKMMTAEPQPKEP